MWYMAGSSIPLFLILRWSWRHLVWGLLLRDIARLDLRLVASHPDGSGGLAFIGDYPNAFAAFVFALSCAVAAPLAYGMLHGGTDLKVWGQVMGAWLIVVAVVGGAAESLSAIAAARKNRLDQTMGIAFGSCIQIALFIAPVLVLLSAVVAPERLQLSFHRAELGFLLFGVLIGAVISGDGKGNWYKGVQLVTVYALIALMLFLVPGASP